MTDASRKAERARQYLNDPLIQGFLGQTKDALYAALESASERDAEHLKNLCLMAKQRKTFMSYLESFLQTEQIEDMNKKPSIIDSVARFVRRD